MDDKLLKRLVVYFFGCILMTNAVRHRRNLIWSMSPSLQLGVSRIVGIEGDPEVWVPNANVTVRHISAPHIGWQFRGLAFQYATQTLYWSEKSNKRVQSLVLNGSTSTRSIYTGSSREVDGLVVDWVSNNLYLADPNYNWIMLVPLNTTETLHRLVIRTGLDKPHGLAVYPKKGYLFWSDWGDVPKIEMSDLLGKNRRTVVDKDIGHPRGMAVDYQQNILYWVDSYKDTVESVEFNGNSRRILVVQPGTNFFGIALFKGFTKGPKIEMSDLLGKNRRTVVDKDIGHPRDMAVDYQQNILYWVDSYKDTVESVEFNGNSRRILVVQPGTNFFGIALFKKFLFVTEQEEGHLRIYDKYSGKGYINYQLGYTPYGVIMYDDEMQPIDSYGCRDLGCDQICVDNPPAGPQCYCADGYELNDDQKTCEQSQYFVEPSHIYAIRDAICQYPARIGDMSLANITLDKQCFLKTSKGFLALTFDGEQQTLYYTENNTNSIGRVQLRKGAYTDTVIRGVGEVKGLALDWTAGNLYWTDSSNRKIMVAKTDGRYQKALIKTDLVAPLGIAVHPRLGRLYWSDPGRSVIESALMNGERRNVIEMKLATPLHPNHIFIDYKTDKLYWADSEMHAVCTYDLKTGDDEVLYRQQFSSFYGISVYQDFLIWTDSGDMNGIHIADMTTLTKKRGILHPQVGKAGDVILYDKLNQPKFNGSCTFNNGGCDQLCLSSFCSCGVGFDLSDDLKSCYSDKYNDDFVLVADAYQKQIFQIGMLEGKVNAIIVSEHERPIALDYDPIRGKVYWTDNEAKTIKGAYLEGHNEITLKAMATSSVLDGISVDFNNQLLYYTDAGQDTISVISLSRPNIFKTIISDDLQEPRDIVVHPSIGRLFWTDWGAESKIEAAYMDGTNRVILVNFTTTSWPNGITLDYRNSRLYWIDARNDKIETIDLSGGDRKVILQEEKAHYFGIALSGDYLYFTDWTKNYVSSILKSGEGSIQKVGPEQFSRLNGIVAHSMKQVSQEKGSCMGSNCDHLCIPLPGKTFTCACADKYYLRGSKCKLIGDNSTDDDTLPEPKINSTMILSISKQNLGRSLQTGGIVAIAVVCAVVTVIAVIASVMLYRRWRNQFIRHDRLVEDNQIHSFYRIAFPDSNKNEPEVDIGIENPYYNRMIEQNS